MGKLRRGIRELNVIQGKDKGESKVKKLSALTGKISLVKGLAGLAVMAAVFCASTFTSLAATGTVTAETAKIRKETSTDSEVVGSTVKGKKIDILEAVKDSAGTVWYKVSVAEGGYGYIRSDLVQTSEDIKVTSNASGSSSESQTAASSTETAEKPAETVPTSIGEQQATVKSSNNSVRIRSGASTKHDTVTSLPGGTSITLIGEANDSAGNKWYQITCNYNNKTVEGYIRSDLIDIGTAGNGESTEGTGEGLEGEGTEGEALEGAEGEIPEEPQEEVPEEEPVPENNDYEIVYTQNDAGEYEYYLYDNINGTRQKLNDLLTAVGAANENTLRLQGQMDNQKIIIIILAVVIVILFIVLTILLFKIRDLSYEYEYEEEDEEEEEEPVPVKKKSKKRVVEEEEPPAVRTKKSASSKSVEKPAKAQDRTSSRNRGDGELHAAERKEPVKRPAPRKPQNFLVDDDEFEFEFLNMDDKDL